MLHKDDLSPCTRLAHPRRGPNQTERGSGEDTHVTQSPSGRPEGAERATCFRRGDARHAAQVSRDFTLLPLRGDNTARVSARTVSGGRSSRL